MRPLFIRINLFVDCLSTETFIKRIYGRSISSVVAESLEIPTSAATKLTWGGASASLFQRVYKRVTDWMAVQKMDVESLANKRAGLIAGYLNNMPSLGDSIWNAETQQYFNNLASLEADLQFAARAKDVARMKDAMRKSGVGRYVAMVPLRGYRQWDEMDSVAAFRKESLGYSRLLALIGVALLDHELRVAIWPDCEARPVFSPLLPQYRIARGGSLKGEPVRPERRMLDVMYFLCSGREGPPTDEDLFPTNTVSMAKRLQRAHLSAADINAAVRGWPRVPEAGVGKASEDAEVHVEDRVVFEAYLFAAKALGLLFDNTRRAYRHVTVPDMQRNYYVVWKSIRDASPRFSGGSEPWGRTRLERLIRDEIAHEEAPA